MSRLYTVLFLLCAICSNIMAQVSLLPVSKKALYEKSSLYYTEFDKLTKERSLPIGVFDSGTGGFTVLERMLQQDRFNNKTGKEEPDGIADFSHEDFEYLADQANMPYGRYESENKGDYLRELAVKDALFLINGKYWKDKAELLPSGKKKGVKIITVTENTDSPLAAGADVVLKQHVNRETDRYNCQGTTSFAVTSAVFDALQCAVLEATGFRNEDFAVIHPNGAVGKRLNRKD